jgi:hypothetical protein
LAAVVGGGIVDDAAAPAAQPERTVQTADLDGLWSRYEGMSEGDPVRFWYFHGDGHGLYRYGKVGFNNTHSFDYSVDGDRVKLRFRKTGTEHELRATIEEREAGRVLRFDADPRDPGARYTWARGPIDAHASDVHPSASDGAPALAAAAPFAGRMWMDMRSFATGGAGFTMYQFAPAAIDGRGVGWFHEGDFDEWRTEALTYRADGPRLELWFDLRSELGISEFSVESQAGRRVLELAEDPRDFWLHHRYRDIGGSFDEPHATHMIADAALLQLGPR